MPWDRTVPTDPKYRTPEHRRERARLVRLIKQGHALTCTAVVCLINEPITNTNGNAPDGLHLGHNNDGVTYAGAQHNACNVRDGARRASARSHGKHDDLEPKRWTL